MFPNLTLEINKYKPKLVYYPEEGMSRVLVPDEEDIYELSEFLAKELELFNEADSNSADNIVYLLTAAEEGDERMIEKLPSLDKFSRSFGLKDFIIKELKNSIEKREDYENYEVDIKNEVLNELKRNQNLDIFASLMESIYNILIAKTLVYSSDLGIGIIRLNDQSGLLRLQGKMASELSKIGIELKLVNSIT